MAESIWLWIIVALGAVVLGGVLFYGTTQKRRRSARGDAVRDAAIKREYEGE